MAVCPSGSVFDSYWMKSRSCGPSASTVLYVHLCAGAKGDVLAVVMLVVSLGCSLLVAL